MDEHHSNLGYMAVKKQSDKLTADTPDVYLPIYSADIRTNANFQGQNPIIGAKFGRRSTLRGQRGHTGSVLVEGEPVTAGYIADMFATKGTTTGDDPYTHPFTFSKSADPNYYTVDISYVTHVVRFVGFAVSSIAEEWEDNELRLNCGVSALKSIDALEIASVAEDTGVRTIVFKTEKDSSPTTGLVVGDIMQVYDVNAGTYINFEIDSIVDGTSITCSEDVEAAEAGDIVTIRPASAPSYSNLPAFEFANTEYRFGATAAAALTATHTPLHADTSLSLNHEFEDAEGSKFSGSHDPIALPRMQPLYEFTSKVYFDDPQDLQRFISMDKRACVVRHFAYSGSDTYELRTTLNNMTQNNPVPNLANEEMLYSEIENMGNYDASDGQGMGLTVINDVSTI